MSSFTYKCSQCKRTSKNFSRFTQCVECLTWFCSDCTGMELTTVKKHMKDLEKKPDFVDHVVAQGGLKLKGKPWSFNRLCCVDCYNKKLDDLGVDLVYNNTLASTQFTDMEVETKYQ